MLNAIGGGVGFVVLGWESPAFFVFVHSSEEANS